MSNYDFLTMPHLPFGPTLPTLGNLPGVQMTPQATPPFVSPHPTAAPMPAATKLGLFDRLRAGLSQLGDILTPTPDGVNGLLTPDEINAAKKRGLLMTGLGIWAGSQGNGIAAPGLGQALMQGVQSGQQAYNSDINTAIQQHAVGPQIQAQNAAIQRQQEILKNRQQIMQRFPPPTSGSDADMQKWAQQVFPLLVSSGDVEAARTLSPLVEKYATAQAASKLNTPQAIQTGEGVTTFVPGRGFYDPKTNTYVPYVDRGLSGDEKQVKQQEALLREMSLRQGMQEFQIRDAEQTARAFDSRNKLLTTAAQMYVNAKSAIQEAKNGNPAAMHSAILNLATAVDPRAQLRQGTIDFIKKIDPSFSGNLQAFLTRVANGNLPPEQLDEMDQLLDRIHADQAALYEKQRAGDVKRHPLADAYIPPTEEIFGPTLAPGANATTPISAPGQSGAERVRKLLRMP